jgi:hypothetical protein
MSLTIYTTQRTVVNEVGINKDDTIRILKEFIAGEMVRFFPEDPDNVEYHRLRVFDYDTMAELADDTRLSDLTITTLDVVKGFAKMNPRAFTQLLASKLSNHEQLRSLLSETRAVIAGGSVLSPYAGYAMNDLDIYVNASNARQLVTGIKDVFSTSLDFIPGAFVFDLLFAPPYDESFMRKNHINSIIRARLLHADDGYLEIDIMIIPDDIAITDVVTNFDLTFCQIWFDGENVLCTNKQHILDKHGKLNDEYLQSYANGNLFIKNRIRKYIYRGFQIDYNGCIQQTLTRKDVSRYPYGYNKKEVVSDEDWVAKKLYVNLLKFIARSETERLFPQLVANMDHANRTRLFNESREILLDLHLTYVVYFKDSFAAFLNLLHRAIEDHPEPFQRVMGMEQMIRDEHILVELMYPYIHPAFVTGRFYSKIQNILGITRLDEILDQNDAYFPIHYTTYVTAFNQWWGRGQ